MCVPFPVLLSLPMFAYAPNHSPRPPPAITLQREREESLRAEREARLSAYQNEVTQGLSPVKHSLTTQINALHVSCVCGVIPLPPSASPLRGLWASLGHRFTTSLFKHLPKHLQGRVKILEQDLQSSDDEDEQAAAVAHEGAC